MDLGLGQVRIWDGSLVLKALREARVPGAKAGGLGSRAAPRAYCQVLLML